MTGYQIERPATAFTASSRYRRPRQAIPLCLAHHIIGEEAQHQDKELDFWARHDIDPIVLALALWRASGDDELGFLVLLEARRAQRPKDEISDQGGVVEVAPTKPVRP